MVPPDGPAKSDNAADDAPTSRKVLVIGCTGFTGVKCADWESLAQIPNIADFPTVVVAMESLCAAIERLSSARRAGDAEIQKAENLARSLSHNLEILRAKLRQVLRARGQVFAIVHPYVSMWPLERSSYSSAIVDSHDWMPLPVSLREEPGEDPNVMEKGFRRYFLTVKRWEYVFSARYSKPDLLPLVAHHLEPRPEPRLTSTTLAADWQGHPIGLALFYALHNDVTRDYTRTRQYEQEPSFTSGPFILLPPPTEGTIDEAIRVVLEDFCGVTARATAPEWITSVSMPGAKRIDADIRAKEKAIEGIQTELTPLLTERRRREQFKAILYETGIEPLQDVVKAVFEELGLTTKPSKVSDEFVVEHEGREFLVEVKGNDRSAKLTDLRQLIDYQLEHEQKHGSPIKSALIVNAWRSVLAEKRGQKDTVVFPDNVIRRARDNNIALLDTADLYNALNNFWLGQTDGRTVFEALFNGSGPVSLL